MSLHRTGLLATCFAASLLAGCTSAAPRQADVPLAAMGPKPLPGAQTDGEAERAVMGATACWMGGLWSDALGEKDAATDARTAGIERRCTAVLAHLYGAVDPMQYRQLRAVEPRVVDDLAARVQAIASNGRVDAHHAADLVKLLRGVAGAQRENVIARAAADDVKRDAPGASTPAERVTDKEYAADALRRTAGIEALLALDAGDLTHEAHAIGLLAALDRMEIARKLPMHLKVYAVGGAFVPVFGVRPPVVPADPAAPLRNGTWLGYLSDVAGAAGHAVPEAATMPLDRETLAWGGVLQAFADRLRAETADVSPRTPLPMVLGNVADRLDRENHTLRALFAAERRERER